jgi:RNA polymerase sigma factor (sigma-70 family)
MSSAGSHTHWVRGLKAGDQDAAQQLWQRYFEKLVGLARKKLWGARRRVDDEEDVALSAFDSFCRGAAGGRFPKLLDRNDLWGLLIVITARKAIDLVQHERRDRVAGESALPGPPGDAAAGIEQVVGKEPSPEFAAQVAEEYQQLLDRLGDDRLQAVAQSKLEGYTNAEIAAKLGCSVRTVEQKLRAIRAIWREGGAR